MELQDKQKLRHIPRLAFLLPIPEKKRTCICFLLIFFSMDIFLYSVSALSKENCSKNGRVGQCTCWDHKPKRSNLYLQKGKRRWRSWRFWLAREVLEKMRCHFRGVKLVGKVIIEIGWPSWHDQVAKPLVRRSEGRYIVTLEFNKLQAWVHHAPSPGGDHTPSSSSQKC